jgi:alkaline phosphatase
MMNRTPTTKFTRRCSAALTLSALLLGSRLRADEPQNPARDAIRDLQESAATSNESPVAHWGPDPKNYKMWASHSNRLIPIYAFGTKGAAADVDLTHYSGANSLYRKADAIRDLYDYHPPETLNPAADYCDQTDLYRIQRAALEAGKKHIFLVVFDGMDWQTTRAAAIYKTRSVGYDSGRGKGLHFQDYQANGTTQFGFMVTSPHNAGTKVDVDLQTVINPNGTLRGGYSVERGGPNPWTPGNDLLYPISRPETAPMRHAYTDSSSSAQSMTTGTKTYNNAINVDHLGRQVMTIAHEAQRAGYAVGAVTSVPICHATPAATYAHNVDRDDYQDLTRDLIGRPSISHPDHPLAGLDVLIGTGYGVAADTSKAQGANFVPGNIYLTEADRKAIDVQNGGRYLICQRAAGVDGRQALVTASHEAAAHGHRLLGFFGTPKGHLPFATADGQFNPTLGQKDAESYTSADLVENPRLTDIASAALTVLSRNPKGFWLMLEAGDVDWGNHDDNIDNSIGATLSGDAAVKTVTDWVEANSNWDESVMIVTADHGHYLVIEQPEMLIPR